jgi:hypothetical protein
VSGHTNANSARRGFELWNERRFEDLLVLFHDEAVWDMRPFGVPDMAARLAFRSYAADSA